MDLSPFWAAVKSAVESRLAQEGKSAPEENDIREALERVLPVMSNAFGVDPWMVQEGVALRIMLSRIAVKMQTGTALRDRAPHTPWVKSREIEWECWGSYEGDLLEKGFPEQVVRVIRHDTEQILDLLEDPQKRTGWDRRGLVLGHVQSGKTSNYSGLISRAADAGYKLFIVIAGIHENLRSQTQQRMNEAFIDLAPAAKKPISLTTPTDDFARSKADQRIPPQGVGTSLVLVVKKNAIILNNLLTWLKDNSRPGSDWADMPLLLIDDEADNASINTNKPEFNPTRINELIRSILDIFRNSSYVGYTATPFANIFIDPERSDTMIGQDLFPRDFIYCLDAPNNYIGPDSVFIEEQDSYLRDIDDAENLLPRSHKSWFEPPQLPSSLCEAVMLFLLACAVRVRQQAENTHMSMLVNVSPYAAVQRAVSLMIQEKLDHWRNTIKASALMPDQHLDFWAKLQSLYDREYSSCGIPWQEIRTALPEAVAPINALAINSKSPDRLNYQEHKENGLRTIAVGGYSLSRGLTLEGLMISYWNRNSKAYDTLMQMGRWFGYRDDYAPLCRVWMPEDAQGWYAHIAEASLELRSDLLDMAQRGMTPEEFGLKVRNHPKTLIITAKNKMRAGKSMVVRPDLGGRLIETHVVWKDESLLATNFGALKTLVQKIRTKGSGEVLSGEQGHRLWRNVQYPWILDFFHEYTPHRSLLHADNDYLFAWLDALRDSLERKGEQFSMDVLLVSLDKVPDDRRCMIEGIDVGKQDRTVGGRIERIPGEKPKVRPYDPEFDDLPDAWRIGSKQRVASRGIEKAPLPSPLVATITERAILDGKKNVPDHYFRSALERPLLMLHLIDLYLDKKHSEQPLCQNVAAWGISFPSYRNLSITSREYTVNPVWMRQFTQFDEEEEED